MPSRMAPAVAFRFDRTARPIRLSAWLLGSRRFSTAVPGRPCHLASLVRGSSSAVARSAIRIATSTATVMRRNSACISG